MILDYLSLARAGGQLDFPEQRQFNFILIQWRVAIPGIHVPEKLKFILAFLGMFLGRSTAFRSQIKILFILPRLESKRMVLVTLYSLQLSFYTLVDFLIAQVFFTRLSISLRYYPHNIFKYVEVSGAFTS